MLLSIALLRCADQHGLAQRRPEPSRRRWSRLMTQELCGTRDSRDCSRCVARSRRLRCRADQVCSPSQAE
jgi:hypothetical protein